MGTRLKTTNTKREEKLHIKKGTIISKIKQKRDTIEWGDKINLKQLKRAIRQKKKANTEKKLEKQNKNTKNKIN